MTSYLRENVHMELLNKLLSDSGLECFRSPPESTVSSSSSGTSVELGPTEEEEEPPSETVEEEGSTFVIEETVVESLPEIFPSPSLRHVRSDKARAIEKQNTIHVLPKEFQTNIDPQAIPKILNTPQQKYIQILAEMVGCTRYKSSLAEFWFLDTLANLLRRAQEDELDRPTQGILILWFCEWMKEMQHFDAADRKRMIRRFQDNMLAATRYIVERDELPTPAQAGVYYKAMETNETAISRIVAPTTMVVSRMVIERKTLDSAKNKVHFGSSFECCIRDLAKIIHYIFDLFSTDYQYNLVRSVFTFTPDYSLIDAPYQIQKPKRLYVPLKIKARKPEKSPKKAEKSPKDAKDTKPIRKKKEVDTVEYLAFLEKKAAAARAFEDQAEQDMEQWNLKSHILPLNLAVNEEFFNKYWPPPPPPPVVETPPMTPKGKGKKGKK